MGAKVVSRVLTCPTCGCFTSGFATGFLTRYGARQRLTADRASQRLVEAEAFLLLRLYYPVSVALLAELMTAYSHNWIHQQVQTYWAIVIIAFGLAGRVLGSLTRRWHPLGSFHLVSLRRRNHLTHKNSSKAVALTTISNGRQANAVLCFRDKVTTISSAPSFPFRVLDRAGVLDLHD